MSTSRTGSGCWVSACATRISAWPRPCPSLQRQACRWRSSNTWTAGITGSCVSLPGANPSNPAAESGDPPLWDQPEACALRRRGLRRHLLPHDAFGVFAGAGARLGHGVETAGEVDVLPGPVIAHACGDLRDADAG